MVAVIELLPTAMPVVRPRVPVALPTVADVGTVLAHVTSAVTDRVVPSANVPVAVSCTAVPWTMVGFSGVICSCVSGGALTVSVDCAVKPPKLAVMVVVP